MEGWIKLHRNLIEWEWYNDSKTVHLFIHLLLKSNHSDGKWRGQYIKRGQVITGLNALSASTGISIQSVRTCLKRLESTNEITIKSTNKNSVITIVKYDLYQSFDNDNESINKQVTSNQQTSNKQSTTNNNDNNKENDNNDKTFSSEVSECYDSVVDLFPEKTQPETESNICKWKDEIRKIIEIDKYSVEDVKRLCKAARNDSFWSNNFLSIMKLRNKNKDGIKYIDVFNEKFKKRSNYGYSPQDSIWQG